MWWPLGFTHRVPGPHVPALTTIWNLLGARDGDVVDDIVSAWLRDLLGRPMDGISADGKVLRGSRRADVPGVWLVVLARHDVGSVVHQRQVPHGSHALPTLLALLRNVPLQGHIVTLDAGLLCADTTQAIRAQQGHYLGVIKGNQAEINGVMDDWIAEQVLCPAPRTTRRAARGAVARAHRNA